MASRMLQSLSLLSVKHHQLDNHILASKSRCSRCSNSHWCNRSSKWLKSNWCRCSSNWFSSNKWCSNSSKWSNSSRWCSSSSNRNWCNLKRLWRFPVRLFSLPRPRTRNSSATSRSVKTWVHPTADGLSLSVAAHRAVAVESACAPSTFSYLRSEDSVSLSQSA